MHTIQRFFIGWTKTFQQQGFFGKVIFVAFSLLFLCFLCGVPIAILSPSSPTPEAMDVSSLQTVAVETAFAVINQTATANAPTNTPMATITSLPPTITSTAIQPLVDVLSILGKPVIEVEAILGSTTLITPNDDDDGDLSFVKEWRDYKIGKYSVFVAYDQNGISRVFQVMDGLSVENYPLTEWKQILAQFGVYVNTPPERTAQFAVYWDNYNGYFIAVAGDPMYSVQIAEAEYHP